jgi:hypothetical protein
MLDVSDPVGPTAAPDDPDAAVAFATLVAELLGTAVAADAAPAAAPAATAEDVPEPADGAPTPAGADAAAMAVLLAAGLPVAVAPADAPTGAAADDAGVAAVPVAGSTVPTSGAAAEVVPVATAPAGLTDADPPAVPTDAVPPDAPPTVPARPGPPAHAAAAAHAAVTERRPVAPRPATAPEPAATRGDAAPAVDGPIADAPVETPPSGEVTAPAPDVPGRPAAAARAPQGRGDRPETGPPGGWTVAPHEAGPAQPAVSHRDETPAALAVDEAAPQPTRVDAPTVRPADHVVAPEAPAPAQHARPVVDVPVAEQIAARVTSLELGEDGRYEMSVDLHPAELGAVAVDVVVDGGTVHVTVRADEPAATALLRDALDDLRRDLAAGGLDVGDLSARDRRTHDERSGHDERRDAGAGPDLTIAFPVRHDLAADRGVDVLL